MRICFIGNSHLAALKLGWMEIQHEFPEISIAFFGARGIGWNSFQVTGNRLTVTGETALSDMRLTSGKDYMDMSDYDLFCVHGLGLGTIRSVRMNASHSVSPLLPRQQRVSADAFEEALVNWMSHTTSLAIVNALRTNTESRVIASAQPRLAAGAPQQTERTHKIALRSGAAPRLVDLTVKAANKAYPCRVIFQPEETVEQHILTRQEFSVGSMSLVHDIEHQSHDLQHMNARFGVEMIAPKLETQNELRFYVWNHLHRQSVKKG